MGDDGGDVTTPANCVWCDNLHVKVTSQYISCQNLSDKSDCHNWDFHGEKILQILRFTSAISFACLTYRWSRARGGWVGI